MNLEDSYLFSNSWESITGTPFSSWSLEWKTNHDEEHGPRRLQSSEQDRHR